MCAVTTTTFLPNFMILGEMVRFAIYMFITFDGVDLNAERYHKDKYSYYFINAKVPLVSLCVCCFFTLKPLGLTQNVLFAQYALFKIRTF